MDFVRRSSGVQHQALGAESVKSACKSTVARATVIPRRKILLLSRFNPFPRAERTQQRDAVLALICGITAERLARAGTASVKRERFKLRFYLMSRLRPQKLHAASRGSILNAQRRRSLVEKIVERQGWHDFAQSRGNRRVR